MSNLKTNSRFVLIFFTTLLLIVGCQKDDNDLSLDAQLSALLHKAANGKGLAFFKLPDNNQFSEIPQDPKNPITNEKVALGKVLFHETCLGRNPKKVENIMSYSCASCHHVKAGFQSGIAQGIGEGGEGFGRLGESRKAIAGLADSLIDVQPIRSPTVLNVAYQDLMLWNGQFGATGKNIGTEYSWTAGTPKEKNKLGFQGVETQAIAGQSVHRLKIDKPFLSQLPFFYASFYWAFPNTPDSTRMTDVNAGLAIAAYERTIVANEAPFQHWLRGNTTAMTDVEKKGALLFFGKAACVKCHTGPALNAMEFYALGMNDLLTGQYGAINADATKAEHKGRGGFTGKAEDMFKFKVPQLYNLKDAPFLGHGASFANVKSVLHYKNKAQPSNANVPRNQLAAEFVPLNLTDEEIHQLVTFVEGALYDPYLTRYVPSALPSGFCFPNNDPLSRLQMGCR